MGGIFHCPIPFAISPWLTYMLPKARQHQEVPRSQDLDPLNADFVAKPANSSPSPKPCALYCALRRFPAIRPLFHAEMMLALSYNKCGRCLVIPPHRLARPHRGPPLSLLSLDLASLRLLVPMQPRPLL